MANERYDEENQEEGEYHFSDDQANYDMGMDAAKDSSATAAVVAPKESLAAKLKQHRRIVIGIIIFIVLLGIVYKLVAPSSGPATEFQPGTSAPTTSSAKMPVKQTMTPPPISASSPIVQAPSQQPAVPSQATPPAPVMSQSAPALSPPVATTPEFSGAPASSVTTTTVPTGAPVQNDKSVAERVATLEQQNNAMMNLMQTQYAQKIADTELQNTQLRTEVQELSARISNMEVAFRQLSKMLRGGGGAVVNRSEVMSNPPPARPIQPKMSYTVQAIIPGRAWLKSDSGDTVTVAEGDMLKGYGRITKIDPYDGVVNIDTGNRIISLSYGMSGD